MIRKILLTGGSIKKNFFLKSYFRVKNIGFVKVEKTTEVFGILNAIKMEARLVGGRVKLIKHV